MLLNNIESDAKNLCIEANKTQLKIAEDIGMSSGCISRIVTGRERIVNKTFIEMVEDLGYDVQLTYVKRKASE